ncbi:hypothetical protein FB1_03240 [Flavobacterium branchiophilum NBRC 15030 = ATCC 35035]|nr:hypothetical protein FB1_03240 [Flavobacterium branchiophilum NBRC 15030 = ATCC 35035]
MTRNGEIKFEASMPAFEEIAAKNNSASCILDESNGEIAVLVLIKSFKFKVPLMEEHFNENYMESSQFPKATFKGKINNYAGAKSTSNKLYEVEGDLTIHGVTKHVKTKLTVTNSGDRTQLMGNLTVKPQDYKIEIPSIVRGKIAENVKISLNFNLEQKK